MHGKRPAILFCHVLCRSPQLSAQNHCNETLLVHVLITGIYESQRHIGSRLPLVRQPDHDRRVLRLECDQYVLPCVLYVLLNSALSRSDS